MIRALSFRPAEASLTLPSSMPPNFCPVCGGYVPNDMADHLAWHERQTAGFKMRSAWWIPHHGGPSPFPPGKRHLVLLRTGWTSNALHASWRWTADSQADDDIVAYLDPDLYTAGYRIDSRTDTLCSPVEQVFDGWSAGWRSHDVGSFMRRTDIDQHIINEAMTMARVHLGLDEKPETNRSEGE